MYLWIAVALTTCYNVGQVRGVTVMTNMKTTLYEQVANTLREQIVSGQYRKGELLPSEKELTESMGVSRITVRKALALLAESRLIETSKGRGSVVIFDVENQEMRKEFSEELEEYRRVFDECNKLRLMIEPEIARQAAMIATDAQIERLKKVCNAGNRQEQKDDFHREIAAVLNNKELNRFMDHLIRNDERMAPAGVILPDMQEKVSREMKGQHRRIMNAIAERDAEFAYFYMKEHTRYIQRMYEEYFERIDHKK